MQRDRADFALNSVAEFRRDAQCIVQGGKKSLSVAIIDNVKKLTLNLKFFLDFLLVITVVLNFSKEP